MSEVWSIGERLYKDNFKVRSQMFDTLVAPIALYAAEVTGYECVEDYDIVRRRYAKWVLGLPQGTRSVIVDIESGGRSLKGLALTRALNYENGIKHKSSVLVKEAHATLIKEETRWKTTRKQRTGEYGWTEETLKEAIWEEGNQRMDTLQRVLFYESWKQRKAAQRIHFYQPPRERIPAYLQQHNPQMRLLARYRTGVAFKDTQTWTEPEQQNCRVCRLFKETPDHLVTHDALGRGIKELLGEKGEGANWMKDMEVYVQSI